MNSKREKETAPSIQNMPSSLEPLSLNRRPLYQQIAERLKVYILEQGLKPGDKLPTEQELTVSFGVSRSSVREALRFLQSLGIVQIRQRHGVVVQAPSLHYLMSQLAYGMSFASGAQTALWEARLIIETGALPLICARSTPENTAILDQILKEMEQAKFAAPLYAQLDMRFHRSLVEIAGNVVISELAKVIEDFFSQPSHKKDVTPTQRRLFTEEHRTLRQAIGNGDIDIAQQTLYRHLWRYHTEWGKGTPVEVEKSNT